MVNLPRWQRILILAVMALGLLYVWPNFVPESWRQSVPEQLPSDPISLGLDLRGGSYLLMEADFGDLDETRLDDLRAQVFVILREAKVGFQNLFVRGGTVVFQLRDATKTAEAQALIAEKLVEIEIAVDATGAFTIGFAKGVIEEGRGRTLSQAIEIVRRRIDETGTREPSIQQQGDNRILVQLPGVDNPEEIKAILGTTARMTFHLVREEVRPGVDAVPVGARLLAMADASASGAPLQLVVDDRIVVAGEQLEDAQMTFDQGLPVVSFRFDGSGGKLFCDTTSANAGRLLAIVLDDVIISAPRIDEPICGGSGIIRGSFNQESARDLALLLRAGALPVKLNYIEERTIGPGLGADSIAAGEIASIVGVSLVLLFMFLVYGLFGLFANVAVICNLVLILAVMTAIGATLTLPGIAGIALTIGMAVDANVLIFERMREEARAGRNPAMAIDAGYKRAFATIIDSNLTTLIAGLLLYQFGSGPIKGFAVTLSIGLITSMFTAIMVSRWCVLAWLRQKKRTVLPIG